MFKKRVITALIGIPLLVLLVYDGKLLLLAGVLFITLAGVYELQNMLLGMNLRLPPLIMYVNGALFPVLIYFLPVMHQAIGLYAGITCLLIVQLIVMIIGYPGYSIADIAVSYLASSYIGILASYLILIRHIGGGGFFLLLYVLVLTWTYDTGAYFTGILWGRRLLCPLLSPRKTIEGVAGGLFATVVAALVFQCVHPLFTYLDTVVLGLLIGVFVQVGDLVESVLKRMAGIKDSGTMIPGHGGILDRFDGLLFSAPITYFYLKLFLFR